MGNKHKNHTPHNRIVKMIDDGKNSDNKKQCHVGRCELNLHVNDPLYLHANDTKGTPSVIFKVIVAENYKIWSSCCKFGFTH